MEDLVRKNGKEPSFNVFYFNSYKIEQPFTGLKMKKLLFIPALLISLLVSVPLLSVERAAVIDMRTAVLATQIANDAFKALEEESEYAGNVEKAKLLQSERQSLAEKLQKDLI